MVLPHSITVVSSIRLRSLIGFAQAYPQNPTSKHSHNNHRPHLHRLTRSLNSGLLRRGTMVSPRADHRRDGRLPPGDKAGDRQVRTVPTGNHLAVHLTAHQRPVVHGDGRQVGGCQERARKVRHHQVHGNHVEGPDDAEDTDRGQEHHDEGAAAGASTTADAAQPGAGARHATLFYRHHAVVAWGRVLPHRLRRAGWGLSKRGCL